MENLDLSVIIPCYNEGTILKKNLDEVSDFLDRIRYKWELILIDDKSKDATPEIIKRFADNKRNVKVILHKENIGRGGTVSEGIRIAKGNIVGFIDIDLEVPICSILPLIQSIDRGMDIALAKRIYAIKKVSFLRYLSSIGYICLRNKLIKTHLVDTETGCKFFNRKRILPILSKTTNKGWFWDSEITIIPYFSGYKIIEIPSLYMKNKDKKSTVRLIPDTFDYLINLFRLRKRIKKEFNQKNFY